MIKNCRKCQVDKRLEEFPNQKGRTDGKHSYCRECLRRMVRAGYNKAPHKARARLLKNRETLRHLVENVKASVGCGICGEKEPACLEFHHIDPSKKELCVARLVARKNEKRVMDEIAKCVVLCCNHHRQFHAGKLSITFEVINKSI